MGYDARDPRGPIVIALLLLAPLTAPPAASGPAPTTAELTAWVEFLADKDFTTRTDATTKLVEAGPLVKPYVPELVKLLDTPEGRLPAVAVLGAIGPGAKDAVPALVALLPKTAPASGYGTEPVATALLRIEGPRPDATRAMLISSGKCAPIFLRGSVLLSERPKEVVAHLIDLCADPDKDVREKAATVLGELKQRTDKVGGTTFQKAGESVKGAPAALEKLLADEYPAVRVAAALAIARIAPQLAEQTIPVVLAVARAPEHAAVIDQHHAAEIFAPVPLPATRALIPLFDHANGDVRRWAIGTVSHLVTSDPAVRGPLESALKGDKSAQVRSSAAVALGAWGADGSGSVPALKAALADPDLSVRFEAARALVHVTPRGHAARADAVPVLTAACEQKDEETRAEAARYLASLGAPAKGAVPALRKLLADEKTVVQLEAALALVALDPKAASEAVPALTAALKSNTGTDDPHIPVRAANALAELGPAAKAAVPELVRLFDAKNPHVRLTAATAAARIAPEQAAKATEVLVGLLKEPRNKRNMIRSHALAALANIGAGAKGAAPVLAELLADDGRFHGSVALALIAIDADGAKAAYDWLRNELRTWEEDDGATRERLPELGKRAAPLLPELIAALASQDGECRKCAVRTLGAIGPGAKPALPDLKKLIETDPHPENRTHAAEAVKQIEAT